MKSFKPALRFLVAKTRVPRHNLTQERAPHRTAPHQDGGGAQDYNSQQAARRRVIRAMEAMGGGLSGRRAQWEL